MESKSFLLVLLVFLTAAVVIAQPASFTVTILNRDFVGCQVPTHSSSWSPSCSDWSGSRPTDGTTVCLAAGTYGTGLPDQHPDFDGLFDNIGDSGLGLPRTVLNVVLPTLGADGTPTWNPKRPYDPLYTTAANFYKWYHDDPTNTVLYTEATFVYTDDSSCGGGSCYMWDEGTNAGPYFPIDAAGWGNWCWVPPLPPAAGDSRPECLFRIDREVSDNLPCVQHNFHFTDHLTWDFILTDNTWIAFQGDDDTWIFINGVLVLDLGGINWNTDIKWTADEATMEAMGLTVGNIYTMSWFHAQRKVDCSHHTMWTTLFPVCMSTNQGQQCGPQPGVICQERACNLLNQCVITDFDDTVGCPHLQGAAGNLTLCNQQACVNGTCQNNLPYADPACDGQATSTCHIQMCTPGGNVCDTNIVTDTDNRPLTATPPGCPVAAGFADGLPYCQRRACVSGSCLSNISYDDPACAARTDFTPVSLPAQCNTHACINGSCPVVPWYYPGAIPQYPNISPNNPTTEISCNDTTGRSPNCWRPYCVPDTTDNSPYGYGVCGGQFDNTNQLKCPPPVAPNGQTVNVNCYVPQCDNSTSRIGYCSVAFISGLGNAGGANASHPGSCPMPVDPVTSIPYDARCAWPYCDKNGQCTADILNGTTTPYNGGWRNDSGNTLGPCPTNSSYNPQCWRPMCVGGFCGGNFYNLNSTCTPTAAEADNVSSTDCIYYVCGSSGADLGHCIRMFNICDCSNQNPTDTCGKMSCVLASDNSSSTCQRVANTSSNGVNCNVSATGNCTTFACGNGTCLETPINTGKNCSDPVGGVVTQQCNHYVCQAVSLTHGACVSTAMPNGSACTDNNSCTKEACFATANGTLGTCNVTSTLVCSVPDQCQQPGICNPATGKCAYLPQPAGHVCFNFSDIYCGNYTCSNNNSCDRRCLCGNGQLDAGEMCDPTVANEAKWCNQTCYGHHPSKPALSTAAIVGIAIAAAALLAAGALALAFVIARAAGGPGPAALADPLLDPAVPTGAQNPLYAGGTGSSNPLYSTN